MFGPSGRPVPELCVIFNTLVVNLGTGRII